MTNVLVVNTNMPQGIFLGQFFKGKQAAFIALEVFPETKHV